MMTTQFDPSVSDNSFLRAGLDAWYVGFSTSMLMGLRTLEMVSEAQVRAMSAVLASTAAPSTTVATVASPAPSSHGQALLEAVLPQDSVRDAPLRMYSGSRDVVAWSFDNK